MCVRFKGGEEWQGEREGGREKVEGATQKWVTREKSVYIVK